MFDINEKRYSLSTLNLIVLTDTTLAMKTPTAINSQEEYHPLFYWFNKMKNGDVIMTTYAYESGQFFIKIYEKGSDDYFNFIDKVEDVPSLKSDIISKLKKIVLENGLTLEYDEK